MSGSRDSVPDPCVSRYTLMRETWVDIQYIIGPHKRWPSRIRRIVWKKHIRHFERILISAFFYINGLNPEVLVDFLLLRNPRRASYEIREIKNLLKKFDVDPSRYKYYGFNVCQQEFQYLNGSRKQF